MPGRLTLSRLAVTAVLAAPWLTAPAPAAADTCSTGFGQVEPCAISASAAVGAQAQPTIQLRFWNFGTTPWYWNIYPSVDPACQSYNPELWASFNPFAGPVAGGTANNPLVTITMSAAGLPPGIYTAYACVDAAGSGALRFPVPLTFTVGDDIFADGFEAGTLDAWSPGSATGGGDLSVSGAAAMGATAQGLLGVVNDTTGLYVQDDTPNDEGRYRARFSEPARRVAAIVLRRLGGAYGLMGRARLDDNAQEDTGFFAIDDGPHVVEIDLVRASDPDALDGSFELWIDGQSKIKLTGLDNNLAEVDFVRLGALSVKSGAAGELWWDEFRSHRITYIGP
jgi:hypothetical protein